MVNGFLSILNSLVHGSVDTDRLFVSESLKRETQASISIAPRVSDPFSQWIPLLRVADDRPLMFLQARYNVELDQTGKYLQVGSSGFHLLTKVQARKLSRPIVRVEYDRTRRGLGRAAAHLHVHAHSPELAWVYGSNRQDAADLHKLHFPVGGRFFRPTLEDFLLFLDREKIFNNWKPGWRSAISASLEAWNLIQAAAAVRRHEDVAIATLEQLGHSIGRRSGASTPRGVEDDGVVGLPIRAHGSHGPAPDGNVP